MKEHCVQQKQQQEITHPPDARKPQDFAFTEWLPKPLLMGQANHIICLLLRGKGVAHMSYPFVIMSGCKLVWMIFYSV
jgi:hypothetical protein